MNRIFKFCSLALCSLMVVTIAFAGGPPAVPPLWKTTTNGITPVDPDSPVVIGAALQMTGDVVRWDVEDLNGDVVVRLEAQCSDLTDASQDCTLKIFTMTAGALTLKQTH